MFYSTYDSEVSIHFLAGKHKMHVFCVIQKENEWTLLNRTVIHDQHRKAKNISREKLGGQYFSK